jgi:hypothetical protein
VDEAVAEAKEKFILEEPEGCFDETPSDEEEESEAAKVYRP